MDLASHGEEPQQVRTGLVEVRLSKVTKPRSKGASVRWTTVLVIEMKEARAWVCLNAHSQSGSRSPRCAASNVALTENT